ncbi:MAG: hypothetical protein HFI54_14570 [Lachnospiraceae bacterium]|nr:hypothetical protein [Lachnospiraceae bacterium]RKI75676.1 hypothetical protein D7V90_22495 [bacterium 1xD42-87]
MKVFLDDAQSAIVIATLHDQQQFLSCLLLNSQLNNTERNNIHRMLRSIKNILDNVKETIDNKYDLSAKQLTVIALSLSAFVDTCQQLLTENSDIVKTNPNIHEMIEEMLKPAVSALKVIHQASKRSFL